MRNILSLVLILVGIQVMGQQQVPGSDFENWTQNYFNPSFPSLFYWEAQPDSVWDSPNEGVTILSDFPTQRTNDAQNGNYAARLETKSIFSVPAAGTLFTGYLIPDGFNTRAVLGIAFTDRPVSFKGYYKYSPVDYDDGGTMVRDSCAFNATLSYWDGSQRVEIATAEFLSGDSVTNYTMFNVPFIYSLPNTPDTISVAFSASYHGDEYKGGVGSTLYIDNISMEYSSDIAEEDQRPEYSISQSEDKIKFFFEEAYKGSISLYDISGRLLAQKTVQGFHCEISLQGLSQGIYIYQLTDENGLSFSNKIIH